MTRKNILLSLVSGSLLFLAFPSFNYYLLAWVALVPLFFAIRGSGLRESFLLGLTGGVACNLGLIYWVQGVMVLYGGLPVYLGVSVMLLLVLYLSLYMGFFALGVTWMKKKGVAVVISAPLLWVALEYIKSTILTGFPWENLGYSQHGFDVLIQLADVTGVYGISFIIVIANCIIFDMFSGRFARRTLVEAVVGLLMFGSVYAYGVSRISKVSDYFEGKETARAAMIQGNIDQAVKWDPSYQSSTLYAYTSLSHKTARWNPDIIVWPETALPFLFQNIDDKHLEVLGVAKKTGAYLLFGGPRLESRNGINVGLNSAYLVSPDADVIGRYDKVHLVPFGEYVPFRDVLFFVERLVYAVGNFASGSGHIPIEMDKEKIGVLICYEGIFPEISRNYRNSGATLLVNITNDAWFGRTSAPWQHLYMTSFRAVENRIYILRAANTGVSAVIDPLGRVKAHTGIFKRGGLVGTYAYSPLKTFYAVYGDVFAVFCMAAAALMILISYIRRVSNDRLY